MPSSAAPSDRPDAGSRARPIVVALALAAILGVFAARCAEVARSDSITCDEATHLVHCLHYWMTGDDLAMWELGAPRLPHALGALASYASGVSRDLFGDYTLAFIVAAIFGFIAAALALQVSSPARRLEPAPATA